MNRETGFFRREEINNIMQFLLCCLFIYCFTHVGISPLQMFKDIYFYAGLCALYLISLVIKKSRLFTWPKVIFVVVAFAGILFYQYVHRNDWGYQYRDMLIAKHTSYLMFALVVWDAFERGKKVFVPIRNKVLACLFAIAFIYAFFIDKEYILVIAAPMLAWYMTGMDKEAWAKFTKILALASYTVFVAVMTWSLITQPDGYVSGRYVGFFNFPAIGGTLTAFALMSGVFIWNGFKGKLDKKIWRILSLGAILLYPVIAFFMIFNRAAFLGIFFMLIFMYVISARENRKKKAKKRAVIALVTILLLTAAGVITIKVLQNSDLSGARDYIMSNAEKPGIYAVGRLISTLTSEESYTGVFEAGTLLNTLDDMSSGRVALWYLSIKNVKLFGGSELGVMFPNGDYFAHIHNTYLDWFLRLGVIGGALMLAWFICCIVCAIKRHLEHDEAVSFTLMWVLFAAAFVFMEREMWTTVPTFMILVLQYPLLMKFKDDNVADTE